MTQNAIYSQVAGQIAQYLNSFKLAFKTYHVSDFDEMIKTVAGESARVSTQKTSEDFEYALLERGFVIYPKIANAADGYVRVIRANSIVGNLLNSFKYVGSSGDEDLAKLLIQLKRQNRYFSGAEIVEE